jgi:hypothetical protein
MEMVEWFNRYTRISGTRLVEDLLSKSVVGKKFDGVCSDSMGDIPGLLALMGVAVVIKVALYLSQLSLCGS